MQLRLVPVLGDVVAVDVDDEWMQLLVQTMEAAGHVTIDAAVRDALGWYIARYSEQRRRFAIAAKRAELEHAIAELERDAASLRSQLGRPALAATSRSATTRKRGRAAGPLPAEP